VTPDKISADERRAIVEVERAINKIRDAREVAQSPSRELLENSAKVYEAATGDQKKQLRYFIEELIAERGLPQDVSVSDLANLLRERMEIPSQVVRPPDQTARANSQQPRPIILPGSPDSNSSPNPNRPQILVPGEERPQTGPRQPIVVPEFPSAPKATADITPVGSRPEISANTKPPTGGTVKVPEIPEIKVHGGKLDPKQLDGLKDTYEKAAEVPGSQGKKLVGEVREAVQEHLKALRDSGASAEEIMTEARRFGLEQWTEKTFDGISDELYRTAGARELSRARQIVADAIKKGLLDGANWDEGTINWLNIRPSERAKLLDDVISGFDKPNRRMLVWGATHWVSNPFK
ncbi:hypothetical protein EBZ37_15225, partial [bacterium]|nr:hypothetical protein [bacterium]